MAAAAYDDATHTVPLSQVATKFAVVVLAAAWKLQHLGTPARPVISPAFPDESARHVTMLDMKRDKESAEEEERRVSRAKRG